MKSFLLVLSLLFSGAVLAQNNVDALTQLMANLNSKFSSDAADMRIAFANYTQAEDKIKAAQAAFDKSQKDYRGSQGWFATGSGDRAYKAAAEQAQASLKSANDAMVPIRQKRLDLQNDMGSLANQLNETKLNLEQTQKALNATFKANGVMTQFSDLQAKAGSANTAMQFLNQQMDTAAIGVYVQNKMKNMLNSKLVCEAQKMCSGGRGALSDREVSDGLAAGAAVTAPSVSNGSAQ